MMVSQSSFDRLGTHWHPPPREEGETLEEWLEACRTAYVRLPDGQITTPALYTRSTIPDEDPPSGDVHPAHSRTTRRVTNGVVRTARTVTEKPSPPRKRAKRIGPDWTCVYAGCRTPDSPHKAHGMCNACARRYAHAQRQGLSLEEYDRRAANRFVGTCTTPGCQAVIHSRRLQVCKWHYEKQRAGRAT